MVQDESELEEKLTSDLDKYFDSSEQKSPSTEPKGEARWFRADTKEEVKTSDSDQLFLHQDLISYLEDADINEDSGLYELDMNKMKDVVLFNIDVRNNELSKKFNGFWSITYSRGSKMDSIKRYKASLRVFAWLWYVCTSTRYMQADFKC